MIAVILIKKKKEKKMADSTYLQCGYLKQLPVVASALVSEHSTPAMEMSLLSLCTHKSQTEEELIDGEDSRTYGEEGRIGSAQWAEEMRQENGEKNDGKPSKSHSL